MRICLRPHSLPAERRGGFTITTGSTARLSRHLSCCCPEFDAFLQTDTDKVRVKRRARCRRFNRTGQTTTLRLSGYKLRKPRAISLQDVDGIQARPGFERLDGYQNARGDQNHDSYATLTRSFRLFSETRDSRSRGSFYRLRFHVFGERSRRADRSHENRTFRTSVPTGCSSAAGRATRRTGSADSKSHRIRIGLAAQCRISDAASGCDPGNRHRACR